MRMSSKTVLASGLILLVTSPAWAQQGRGRGGFAGGGGGMGAALYANKSVQKELKATDDQTKKLDALAEESRSKQQAQFQKLRDASQEERREKIAELTRTANADSQKSLAEILKPEQLTRFEQIRLQQSGAAAFLAPAVQEKLSLTDDQKSKIREAVGDRTRGGRGNGAGRGNGGGRGNANAADREAALKKMADARKETMDKTLAVLTDSQKQTWKDMTGEPFTVQIERRRPNN